MSDEKYQTQTVTIEPKAVIDRMIQTVRRFVGDTEQSDDLTLMVIRLKEKV
jgi:serine phosphatase RsbU (regulator of sigma subunit)